MTQVINSEEYRDYKQGKLTGKLKLHVDALVDELKRLSKQVIETDNLKVKLIEQPMYSQGLDKYFLITLGNLPEGVDKYLKQIPEENRILVTYSSDEKNN